jgi:molybdate transport system regulatory protein
MAKQENSRQRKKLSRFGRHPQPGYTSLASVWIEKDGELYLGGGRVMLLEKLDELGSIAAAARAMDLTYRNAWLWIDAMNRLAPSPLVEKIIGGKGGGRARLTEEGCKAIASYHALRDRLNAAVISDSASHLNCAETKGNPARRLRPRKSK